MHGWIHLMTSPLLTFTYKNHQRKESSSSPIEIFRRFFIEEDENKSMGVNVKVNYSSLHTLTWMDAVLGRIAEEGTGKLLNKSQFTSPLIYNRA